MRSYMEKIAADYAAVPTDRTRVRVKVGIVGEIYVKFAALANNHLEEFLASEGCEVMVPGLMSFILFKTDNRIEDVKLYGGSKLKKAVATNYTVRLPRRYGKIHNRHRKRAGRVPRAYTIQPLKELVAESSATATRWARLAFNRRDARAHRERL